MPFLFPHFKERLKFKRIVKAEAEENQVRTFHSGALAREARQRSTMGNKIW